MSTVTEEEARRILERHRGGSAPIAELQEVTRGGFDAFTPTKVYTLRTDDGTSYLLKVTPSASATSIPYHVNTLATEHTLLGLLSSQTDIPTPTVHALDTSESIVPYPYLLLSHPHGVPLSHARTSGKLSARQLAMLDLRTGAYLKQLHSRVQNDWFGLPSQEKDELYSWQEAFTPLLEGLLDEAHRAGVELPYADLRVCLSRAIGFFLFDDCEVPSLVSFTSDDHSTFVDFELEGEGTPGGEGAEADEEEVRITSFGAFGHALWGDPLLETLLMDPSAGLIEGYGGPLIVFARQKTKRLWYSLFLALMVLVQAKRMEAEEHEKVQWARELAERSAAALRDAPCY
ncbi:hypothetical protein L226DRAFT_567663 [Lentinus tigrinus ALCF2SS1-7]|uniref:Aminoglycoside phosphotransferase domain-containing protein n=1 Tax=Lentinus tigrinus ALCF2SS1-6 TaxID=1328759 RepID=A0A5C2RZR1_9APHY|nr:hypothetical protein L227DRAFT_531696 [Lentinus tigrinus ALCF2SS1-6]RPD79573.1 hypothetical protein L226DRAFT_567663 [Lentinus tigrinus ALCF2SS1-7]